MRKPLKGLILVVSLILPLAVQAAGGPPQGKPSAAGMEDPMHALFSAEEKRQIRAYFGEHPYGRDYAGDDSGRDKPKKQKALPPGLKKKVERGGELPPGWQKKIASGEVLDGDLYAHSHRLPPDLRRRLPSGPVGTEIRRIENQVVRVLEATGVIVDVLGL